MDAPALAHPTDQTLHAYGLGKLDDAAAHAVDQHLAGCPDCRHRVADLSSDSFLSRLRGAAPRPRTPTPGQAPAGVAGDAPESAPPADTLPPGLAEHPDYHVLRELGRGGMGVVYLAHNRLMGRDEVFKVVGRHLLDRRGVLDRFLREIRAAAKLHHPNVVTAFSAFRCGESIVFAMEYAEGLDLEKLVRSKGPLPVANACSFVHQAALGLQHAHEHGMVHRDIKPGNLMLCRQGARATVKVLDFGLAKATREDPLDGALTHEGQMLGTPDFIAPEQIRDAQSADIRADIYSLGCTLYYLLTGGPPFRGKSLYDVLQAHHSMDAKPLNFVRPDVPVELAALVGKMMAKEPGHRFQTPGEVAKALTPFFKAGRRPSEFPRTEPGQSLPPGPATSRVTPPPTQPATNPEPAPAPPAATSRPGAMWASLIEFQETERSQDAAPAVAQPGRRRPWMWPSVVVGVLLLGLVVAWGAGVFKVRTKQGTVVFENLPEQAIVTVDGNDCTVEWPAGQGRGSAQITIPAGEHDVQVKINGVVMSGQAVIVAPEEGTPFKVTRELPNGDRSPKLVGPREALKPLPRARVVKGTWSIEGDDLVQSSLETDTQLLFGDPDWSRYDLTLQAKKDIDSGKDGQKFTILFHHQGPGFACWYSVYNDAQALGSVVNGNWSRKWERNANNWLPAKNSIKNGQWYSIKVEVRGKAVKCFLDDDLVFDDIHPSIAHGRIGLGSYQIQTRFRRIKVTDPDGKVLFEGLPELDPADLATGTVQPAGGTGSLSTSAPGSPSRAGVANPPGPHASATKSTTGARRASAQSITNTIGMKLALIPAGEFVMGSPSSDDCSSADEKPQHPVQITRPFYLGIHEVTRGQFRRFVDEAGYRTEGEKDGKGGWGWNEEAKRWGHNPKFTWLNPGFEQTDEHPVVNVSWNDAVALARWLSRKEGKTYRLPTEAEWEYACRARSMTRYSFGDDLEGLARVGNITDQTAREKNPVWGKAIEARDGYVYTAPVGQFNANEFGLYDMHGNVLEWCSDWYDAHYYRESPIPDPPGARDTESRVFRGGAWNSGVVGSGGLARSAARRFNPPNTCGSDLGFRVALVPSPR